MQSKLIRSISTFIDFVQGRNQLKLCILDNNNLQFCEQNKSYLKPTQLFSFYDAVLIPKWVYLEIENSNARLAYIEAISVPVFVLEETDYSVFVDYHDLMVMRLFCQASMPGRTPYKYLKRAINLIEQQQREIEDDWIERYYEEGFDMIKGSRKNAGENSILVLAVLLALYLQDHLSQVTICSNDVEVRDIKIQILDYVLKNAGNYPKREKITFLSTDSLLRTVWLNGQLQLADISLIRTNQRRIMGYLPKGDGTHEEVNCVVATEEFIELLEEGLILYF